MSTPTYRLVERKGHWLNGSLRAFGEDRLGFLAESARSAPMVTFRLGHRRVYLLSHPDLIRDLLVTRHRHLTRDPLVRKILEKTLGVGLLTSEGEAWKRHRRWHTFKYFPFGGGPHICIGNQFASVEGPLILATIGQHYGFELLHPNQQLEEVSRDRWPVPPTPRSGV
ncbi:MULTISPECIES: cytochrome P450 [unclassified Thiocapsa]|uniref:cytochrome P450 n=1 Tax=unclassified Thiocapsa TaxID=2641286 RepID=UPI0035B0CA50